MKERVFKIPHIHEYLVVIVMLLLACILTYLIPAGEYAMVVNEAGKEVVDPNSFHFIENTPVSIFHFLILFFAAL